ncbi:brevican core protein-like [Haliotis rubra]|uniref:brevican core protein-like n=1 Tax=Haliotis rubra TaxID=36100 RepID=UPI001EE51E9A|nr:brevican core protein-like [Haliotis rubra]
MVMKALAPSVWPCLVYLAGILQVIQGVSYLYLSEARNYEQGKLLCLKFGLDLAKVTSEADIDDLHNIYANIPGATVAWMGLLYNGNQFLWADGTPVQYSRWNNILDDEPDDLGNSKCAVVKQDILLWHTRKCPNEYPLLCGPYPTLDATSEPRTFSFKKWREGVELLSKPTLIKQRNSSRACAKDCSKLNNCMFYSLGGSWCRMYSDITSFLTQTSPGTVVWKRTTVAVD